VAQGKFHLNNGTYSDNQWKKICYVNDQIKPVKVIVMNNNEVYKLFISAKTGVLKLS